jgi:hypothetical protein
MVGRVIDIIYQDMPVICFVVNFYHFIKTILEKENFVRNSLFIWKHFSNFLFLYYPHGYYLWYIFSINLIFSKYFQEKHLSCCAS